MNPRGADRRRGCVKEFGVCAGRTTGDAFEIKPEQTYVYSSSAESEWEDHVKPLYTVRNIIRCGSHMLLLFIDFAASVLLRIKRVSLSLSFILALSTRTINMFKQKTAFADEYAFIFQTVITSFGAKEIDDFQNKQSFLTFERNSLHGGRINADLSLLLQRGFNTSII